MGNKPRRFIKKSIWGEGKRQNQLEKEMWVLLAKLSWQLKDSLFRAVSAHRSFPVVLLTEQPQSQRMSSCLLGNSSAMQNSRWQLTLSKPPSAQALVLGKKQLSWPLSCLHLARTLTSFCFHSLLAGYSSPRNGHRQR